MESGQASWVAFLEHPEILNQVSPPSRTTFEHLTPALCVYACFVSLPEL